MPPQTFDLQPDTEGILSVKSELKEKGCKDNVLLSNLDFAEKTFRHSPLSKVASLLVKGDLQYVRIGKAENIVYTITSEDGQCHLDGCIYCDDVISEKEIKSIHFSLHSCQNEIKPCVVQAQEAAGGKNVEVLKISCNKFSVTYTVKGTPEKMVMIETRCQFKLAPIDVKGLLQRKCWMEKEKPSCKGLKDGLDHLIDLYLTKTNVPKWNCKFLIYGDGETVEIISSDASCKSQELFILQNSKLRLPCYSIYPSSWEKS